MIATTRILVIGDIHYSETPPTRRQAGYGKQILDKLSFAALTAMKHDVSAVVLTGDLFHRKTVSHYEVNQFLARTKLFRSPIYAIVGNHDVVGHQSAEIEKTGMGTLIESGAIKLLTRKPTYLKKKGRHTVALTGVSYVPDYEKQAPFDPCHEKIKDGAAQLHVTHGMLLIAEDTWAEGKTSRQARDMAHNFGGPVALVNGHVHTPYLCKHATDGVQILNAGSICRASIEDQETNPEPHIYVMQTDGKSWEIDVVVLPTDDDVWTAEDTRPKPMASDEVAAFVQKIKDAESETDVTKSAVLEKLLANEPTAVQAKVRTLLEGSVA